MTNHLGITWTKGPSSWDPLDFDLGNNIVFARMLYSPPFEISKDGHIVSSILSYFEMSESGLELKMKVDSTKKFSDGTTIAAKDVVIAILRMALTRPEFPVIDSIRGLKEWKQYSTPLRRLPEGISISENDILIYFDIPQKQALFRLSLELFSVIPSRCIDLDASKLICDQPPESGAYQLASKIRLDKDLKRIDFKRRAEATDKPLSISISYIDHKKINEFFEQNPGGIVHTSDLEHSVEDVLEFYKTYEVFETPKAWFGVTVLSPSSALFAGEKDRLLFRDRFLSNLIKNQKDLTFEVEASLFTEIMPGYLPKKALLASNINENFSAKKKVLHWISRGVANEGVIKSLNETCSYFSIRCERVLPENYKATDFAEGRVDLIFGKTGFWAKDPLGDLVMLFTPNMHKDLYGIWSNKEILNKIQFAQNSTTYSELEQALQKLNLEIYESGLFNVFAHFKYYYLVDKARSSTIHWIPQSVTEPYPWYLFDD